MYYNKNQLNASSPQMRILLHRQDELKNTDRKAKEMGRLLAKILHLAKEEKNGFVYCRAMMEMIFFQQQFGDPMKGLQYGEMFLRDGRELMDAVMGTTSNPHVMREHYLLVIDTLGELYIEYYQVDAQKLEAFFDLYWNTVREMGHAIHYWPCRLRAALLSNDLPNATKYFVEAERMKKDFRGCYVCHGAISEKYYILKGDLQAALELVKYFLEGELPPDQQNRFSNCENRNPYSQYNNLFVHSIQTNHLEFLPQIAPLLHEAMMAKERKDKLKYFDLLLCALYGEFINLEQAMEDVVDSFEDNKVTPWDKLQDFLRQSIYLELLHQSGVETIVLHAKAPLPISTIGAERYNTKEAAAYFQTQADKIGAAFDKSRPGFDYPLRRKTYQDLLNIKFTG